MQQLPVFVYGTLMKGFGNQKRILNGSKAKSFRTAELLRHDMYNVNDCFPAIIQGAGTIVGELVELNDEDGQYEKTMKSLDGLEGFHKGDSGSMYVRKIVKVRYPGNKTFMDAWVYIWNRQIQGLPLVQCGSWETYRKQNI